MKMTKLLLDESPLVIQPSLAKAIGLNEAIVLQQVHYWLQRSRNRIEGTFWIYNSYPEWQQQFSFWSVATVKRTIANLERQGLLKSGNFNKMKVDKTKWYTIDYDVVRRLAGSCVWLSAKEKYVDEVSTNGASGADHEVDLTQPTGQIDPTIPETSSETTSEITPPSQTGMPKQPDLMKKQRGGGGAFSKDELITYEKKYPQHSTFLDCFGVYGQGRLDALRCGDIGYSQFDLMRIRDEINDGSRVNNPQGVFLTRLPYKQNGKAPCTEKEYCGVPVYEDSDTLRAKYEQKYPELNHVLLNLGIRNKYCLAALRYGDYGYSGSDLQTAWDNAEDSSSNHLQEDRFLEELSRLKDNHPALER
jgi:hypothetical protein